MILEAATTCICQKIKVKSLKRGSLIIIKTTFSTTPLARYSKNGKTAVM
jgi:hypothetical protein